MVSEEPARGHWAAPRSLGWRRGSGDRAGQAPGPRGPCVLYFGGLLPSNSPHHPPHSLVEKTEVHTSEGTCLSIHTSRVACHLNLPPPTCPSAREGGVMENVLQSCLSTSARWWTRCLF